MPLKAIFTCKIKHLQKKCWKMFSVLFCEKRSLSKGTSWHVLCRIASIRSFEGPQFANRRNGHARARRFRILFRWTLFRRMLKYLIVTLTLTLNPNPFLALFVGIASIGKRPVTGQAWLDIRKQWTYVLRQSRRILAVTLSRHGCISGKKQRCIHVCFSPTVAVGFGLRCSF